MAFLRQDGNASIGTKVLILRDSCIRTGNASIGTNALSFTRKDNIGNYKKKEDTKTKPDQE